MTPVSNVLVALFILTLILTIYLFYRALVAVRKKFPRQFVYLSAVFLTWMFLQGVLSWSGFYLVTDAIPPRFPLLIVPTILVILYLVIFKRSQLRRSVDAKAITLMHVIRIPVEIVLWRLAIEGAIPELMTFEGRNYDILAGLSAPLIAWMAFKGEQPNRRLLFWWNVAALMLVLNIVGNAIVSVPGPIQLQAFEQPNTGVLYFPFAWLPSVIVPIVFFGHAAGLIQNWPGAGQANYTPN